MECRAETVSDLYKFYNIEYFEEMPEDSLDIVRRYDAAKRYVQMHKYVAESTYDTSILDNRAIELEERIEQLRKELLNGFDLTLDEIYLKEDEYAQCVKQLEATKKTLKSVKVPLVVRTPSDVPTYSEYIQAKQVIAKNKTEQNIGNLENLKFPVATAALINDANETSIELAVANGTTVTSLFNGKVVRIDESAITVYHGSSIYSLYSGIVDSYVSVGDTLYQGQAIGTTGNKLLLKLKVNGKLVNISELFKEVK